MVGETPSLGRSIVDLLESVGIPARFALDVDAVAPLETLGRRHPLLVVASNGYFCATARRWSQGAIPGVALVVVGSRDPAVAVLRGIHRIPLPLVPDQLVTTVRGLADPRVSALASRPFEL
ncbi:MAG TPA: hypothetical protein VMG81_03240 [Thermoplasmata archaeon]|nr:hypothetical protein [Thermoplasmata archaeon]